MKKKVSEHALVLRINRKLARLLWPKKIRKTRPDSRSWSDLGDYYVLDIYRNCIARTHVDPMELAKELKVVAEYEELQGA